MLRNLKNKLIQVLLNAPVAEDIIRIDSGKKVWLGGKFIQDKGIKVVIGGEQITGEIASQLNQEAHYILNTRLWSVLTSTLLEDAQERVDKSVSWDDIWASKMMKYCISVMQKIVNLARDIK